MTDEFRCDGIRVQVAKDEWYEDRGIPEATSISFPATGHLLIFAGRTLVECYAPGVWVRFYGMKK